MKNEFIPYEQALELKELGFDESCIFSYTPHKFLYNNLSKIQVHGSDSIDLQRNTSFVSAPPYQQAFRWFREKHNLLGNVYSNASGWLWEIHDNIGGTHRFGSKWSGDCEESGMFTSFEKAELECLKKLIEIVKKK